MLISFKEYYHKMEFDYNELPIKIFNIIRNFILDMKRFPIVNNKPFPIFITYVDIDYNGERIESKNNIQKIDYNDGKTKFKDNIGKNIYNENFIRIEFSSLPKNPKKYKKVKDEKDGIEYEIENIFYVYEKLKDPLIIDGRYFIKPTNKDKIYLNVHIKQNVNKENIIKFLDKYRDYHIKNIRSLIVHETTHFKDRDILLKTYNDRKINNSWLKEIRTPFETNAEITALIYTYKIMKNKENVTLLDLIEKSGMYDILNVLIDSPKWTKIYLKRLIREGIPVKGTGFEKINKSNL